MDAQVLSYLATVEPSQAIAWAALIPALISVLGMIRGGGGSSSTSATGGVTTETTDPNLTAMMNLQRQRMEMQNPLYEAVQRLAMGLMPTAYQTGNNYPWGQAGATGVLGPVNPPGQTTPQYGTPAGSGAPWVAPPDTFSPDYLRRATPPQRRPI